MSAERRLLGAAAWSVAARAVQFAVGLAAVVDFDESGVRWTMQRVDPRPPESIVVP